MKVTPVESWWIYNANGRRVTDRTDIRHDTAIARAAEYDIRQPDGAPHRAVQLAILTEDA